MQLPAWRASTRPAKPKTALHPQQLIMRNPVYFLRIFLPLTAVLASCSTQQVALAPSTRYPEQEITRLQRKNPAQDAIIVGHVAVLGPKAESYPLPGAIVVLDQKPFFADAAGNYQMVLAAGKHQLKVGQLGIYPAYLTLEVQPGDSIRVDFHLREDPRPTVN